MTQQDALRMALDFNKIRCAVMMKCDSSQPTAAYIDAAIHAAIDAYESSLAEQDDTLTTADYEEVLADHRRLVRELDQAINGSNAAKQASLCDIVAQVKRQGLVAEQDDEAVACQYAVDIGMPEYSCANKCQYHVERLSDKFQNRVKPWMHECFGPVVSADKLERGDRLLEEVLELLQSGDYPPDRVAALVQYTFGRPKGEPSQEVGGVMVTLAAYCLAHDLDMHISGEVELERINQPEVIEKIRAKQAKKAANIPFSPLPAPNTYTESDIDEAIGAVDWANTSWQQAAVEAKKLVMRFVGSQVTMEPKRLSEGEVELLVGQYGEAHNLNGTNQYVRAIIGDNVDDFANALMDKMTGGGK